MSVPRKIWSILAVTMPAIAPAQDFHKDIRAMGHAMAELRTYELTVDLTISDSAAGPLLRTRVSTARDGTSLLYEMGDVTLLVIDSGTVWVDASLKRMAWTPAGKRAPLSDPTAVNVDSLLATVDSAIAGPAAEDTVRWELYSRAKSGSRAELTIDRKTHLPIAMQYHQKADDDRRVEISVRYIWTLGAISRPEALDLKRYVLLKGNRAEPSAAYLGYNLMSSPAEKR